MIYQTCPLRKAPRLFLDLLRNELDTAALYEQSHKRWLDAHQTPQDLEAYAQWQELSDPGVPDRLQGKDTDDMLYGAAKFGALRRQKLYECAQKGSVFAIYVLGVQLIRGLYDDHDFTGGMNCLQLASVQGLPAATAFYLEMWGHLAENNRDLKTLYEVMDRALDSGDELCLLVCARLATRNLPEDGGRTARIADRLLEEAHKGSMPALCMLLQLFEYTHAENCPYDLAEPVFALLEQRAAKDNAMAHTLLGLVRSGTMFDAKIVRDHLEEDEDDFVDYDELDEAACFEQIRREEHVIKENEEQASRHFARARELGEPWARFFRACEDLETWDADTKQGKKALQSLKHLADKDHFAPAMTWLAAWNYEQEEDSDKVCADLRAAALTSDNPVCQQVYADYIWLRLNKCRGARDHLSIEGIERFLGLGKQENGDSETAVPPVLTIYGDHLDEHVTWEVLVDEIYRLKCSGLAPFMQLLTKFVLQDPECQPEGECGAPADAYMSTCNDEAVLWAGLLAELRPDLSLDKPLLQVFQANAGLGTMGATQCLAAIRKFGLAKWFVGPLREQESEEGDELLDAILALGNRTDCLFVRFFLLQLKLAGALQQLDDPEADLRWAALYLDDGMVLFEDSLVSTEEYVDHFVNLRDECLEKAVFLRDLPTLDLLLEMALVVPAAARGNKRGLGLSARSLEVLFPEGQDYFAQKGLEHMASLEQWTRVRDKTPKKPSPAKGQRLKQKVARRKKGK